VVTNLESGGLKNKQNVIDEPKDKRMIMELCAYLRISRRGYYAYRKRKNNDPNEELKLQIKAIYKQSDKQ